MAKQSFVTATKDGRTKQFTLRNWESMPKDKYGWSLTQEASKIPTPPEAIVNKVEEKPEVIEEKVSILPEKKTRNTKKK